MIYRIICTVYAQINSAPVWRNRTHSLKFTPLSVRENIHSSVSITTTKHLKMYLKPTSELSYTRNIHQPVEILQHNVAQCCRKTLEYGCPTLWSQSPSGSRENFLWPYNAHNAQMSPRLVSVAWWEMKIIKL